MSDHDHDQECAHCAAIAAGMTEEQAWEQGRKNIGKMIDDLGLAIVGIGSDGESPSILHTIGFHGMGLPEVIMFGFPFDMGTHFLNLYHAELLAKSKQPGQSLITDYFNLPVQVIEADFEQAAEVAHQALDYYLHETDEVNPPKFVQWVFSDKNGKFPWEAGFDAHWIQPVIGDAPAPGKNADHMAARVLH